MMIIASVTVQISMAYVEDINLQGFYSKLEIVEEKVAEICELDETFIDDSGYELKIKLASGETPSSEHIDFLNSLSSSQGLSLNVDCFRYFSKDTNALRTYLGLDNFGYDFLIDFIHRVVIVYPGVEIGNNTYYMSKNTKKYIEQNLIKDSETLDYTPSISQNASGTYTIVITPNKSNEGTIEYRKIESKYIEESDQLFFITDTLGTYYVKYIDTNENYIEKKISCGIDEDENLYIETGNFIFAINPTPNDAIVKIKGRKTNSVLADDGELIEWSVEKEGYMTETGSYIMPENDENLNINLAKIYTLTIVSNPEDAKIVITDENGSNEYKNGDQIQLIKDQSINWTAECTYYRTATGTYIMGETDDNLEINLERKQVTFTINPTPSDATVVINGTTTTSLTVDAGSSISYSVSMTNYVTQTGTYTIGEDNETQSITLEKDEWTYDL